MTKQKLKSGIFFQNLIWSFQNLIILHKPACQVSDILSWLCYAGSGWKKATASLPLAVWFQWASNNSYKIIWFCLKQLKLVLNCHLTCQAKWRSRQNDAQDSAPFFRTLASWMWNVLSLLSFLHWKIMMTRLLCEMKNLHRACTWLFCTRARLGPANSPVDEGWKTLTKGHCLKVFLTIQGKAMARHFCNFSSEALQSL